MFDEVIREILSAIGRKGASQESYPKFSGEGYVAHRIDSKNFHEIGKFDSSKKIAFVDGGNAEIIGSANFSLNLLRACCVIYHNNKKSGFKRFEILSLTQSTIQNNEIFYKTSFFRLPNSIDLQEISFSSLDSSLKVGMNRAEIGNVANAIRRFAELKVAKFIADSKIADIIVLDGNLQAALTNESSYLDELYESCSKNNVLLSALGKTSSLFTDDGNLLSAVLEDMGVPGSWSYHPVAEITNPNHKAEMFFVKFHDKSRHIFRFEVFRMQKPNAEEIINALASNSHDPIFIGYPYGMVEADRIARVSKNEKESLKARFLFMLQDRNIEKYLNSRNAHEILDRLSY